MARLLGSAAILAAPGLASHSEPSFLFILADDIGWADVGYNGGTANTPRINQWAERDGTIVMKNFHTAGTVCSPTRASVLTGRNPFRDCVNGVYGCSDPTECTPNFPFAPRGTFTIADAAREAGKGYVSQFWGKWHLGSFYNDSHLYGGHWSSPITHGFDHFNATIEVAPTATTNCQCNQEWEGQCDFGHNKRPTHCNGGPSPGGGDLKDGCCFNYWWEDNTKPHGVSNLTNPVGDDDSAYIADSFERFVRGLDGKPFMAQLSFHNCHMPYIGTSDARKACQQGEACRSDDGHGHGVADFSDAQLDFYACMNELDASVGRALDVLDEQGYYENTMIWFTTDNGPEKNCDDGLCDASHFLTGPGDAGPLRGRKRDIWEGGHRVPGVISWPSMVKGPARESWDLVLTSDFLATVMEVLDVERPKEQQSWGFDGVSAMPTLKGQARPERGMGWLFDGFPSHTVGYVYGKWKYVNQSKSCKDACSHELLYNLETDLGERNDLSEQFPEVLEAIRSNFSVWYASVAKSRSDESVCDDIPTPPTPPPTPTPPSSECNWYNNTGLTGGDMMKLTATSKEDCCAACRGTVGCAAADHRPSQGLCHLKSKFTPVDRDDGSIACVPTSTQFV